MANYQLLKADIDAKVYENTHQEITGANLNAVLNAMVTTLGAGYQFAGVATIDTNPENPDAKVFYIANGKGSYTNFGGLEVTEDDVVVLYWDTAWHKVSTGIASQAKLSELESEIGIPKRVFPVKVGSSHSSNNDIVSVNIKKGEYFVVVGKLLEGASVKSGSLFFHYADGTKKEVNSFSFDVYSMFQAENDIEGISVYYGSSAALSSGAVSMEVRYGIYSSVYAKSFTLLIGENGVLPDINTTTGDMTMQGQIVCGNAIYVVDGKTFNIKGGNKSGALKIVFNTISGEFRSIRYDAAINEDDIIIGAVRTNYAADGIFVNLVHAEFPFDYTLDGETNVQKVVKAETEPIIDAIGECKSDIETEVGYPNRFTLVSSSVGRKTFPTKMFKKGLSYILENNGDRIDSLYLQDKIGNRVQELGENIDTKLSFKCEYDDIVALDGWMSTNIDFVVTCTDGLFTKLNNKADISSINDINEYLLGEENYVNTNEGQSKFKTSLFKKGHKYKLSNGSITIDSLYLSTSYDDAINTRVQEIGINIPASGEVEFVCQYDGIECVNGYILKDVAFSIENVDSVKSQLKNLNSRITVIELEKLELSLDGNDNNYVSAEIATNPNKEYIFSSLNTKWEMATNDRSYGVVGFELINGDERIERIEIASGNNEIKRINGAYLIKSSGTIKVGFRAKKGVTLHFIIAETSKESSYIDYIFDGNSIKDITKMFEGKVFLPKIATLKKKTPYNQRIYEPLTLLWFSDSHAEFVNIERIGKWVDSYSEYIDDVLNCGDTIYDNFPQTDKILPYFEKYNGANYLLALGNHDVTSPSSANKEWDGTYTPKQIYDQYIAKLNISNLGIIQPSGASNGKCYYYKDYQRGVNGVRLIVIDSCITDESYQQEQLTWFESVLNEAKLTNKSVLVASHYTPKKIVEFSNADGFASGGLDIIGTDVIKDDYIIAVDNYISNGGDFISWLCGHVHSDRIGVISEHTNQLVIAVNCTYMDYMRSAINPYRAEGCVTQDAFDILGIDTYYALIRLVRVGMPFNSLGKKIDMLTVNYKSKKIVE